MQPRAAAHLEPVRQLGQKPEGRQGYVLGQLHQKWWLQAGRK